MRRSYLPLSALLTVILFCAGCGADQKAALKQTAGEYTAAYLSGHGDQIYAMWSNRCRATQTLDQVKSADDSAVLFFAGARQQSLSVKVNGHKGQVSETFDQAAINKTDQPWVLEKTWKWDGCV